MAQKEGGFQSKSGKFGGGGRGKGGPGGRSFGKKFEGDRGGERGGFKGRSGGGFKGRDDRGGDKPYRKREWSGGGEGGADKPFKKRFDREGGGSDRPFKKRFDRDGGGGDRPFKKRFDREGGGDRPFKKYDRDGGGAKPFRKKWEGGEGGDFKPRADRGGDRPFKKPFRDRDDRGGDRPFKKKWEDRSEGGGFKGREDRAGGDRPFKKPFRDRDDRGGGDRPFKKPFRDRDDRGGFKSREGGGDRPFKKPFRDRDGEGGGFKGRGEGGGGFKPRPGGDRDERPRGDRHKPYKRNFENRDFEKRSRKPFRAREEAPDAFLSESPELADVSEVTPFEASAETRQKLKSDRSGYGAPSSAYLYGLHAVREALKNPKRTLQRLLVTEKGFESIREAYEAAQNAGIKVPEPSYLDSFDLERLLPRDAVHQGVLLDTQPPEEVFLSDVLNGAEEHAKILVLDQVTDPHNVGAILRSAAAFGAIAVVVQKLHAPDITGTLAKSASGAVEHIPMVREVNLTRALEQMKEAGFFTIGLAEEGKETLSVLAPTGKVALVLGAEGEGLRRLVAETCDTLAKLPTSGPISSLNVSNAAAVALYELTRGQ